MLSDNKAICWWYRTSYLWLIQRICSGFGQTSDVTYTLVDTWTIGGWGVRGQWADISDTRTPVRQIVVNCGEVVVSTHDSPPRSCYEEFWATLTLSNDGRGFWSIQQRVLGRFLPKIHYFAIFSGHLAPLEWTVRYFHAHWYWWRLSKILEDFWRFFNSSMKVVWDIPWDFKFKR